MAKKNADHERIQIVIERGRVEEIAKVLDATAERIVADARLKSGCDQIDSASAAEAVRVGSLATTLRSAI